MMELAYLGAGVLFIVGLKGLTSPASARRGNRMAALGMLVATITVVIEILDIDAEAAWWIVIAGLAVGGDIGGLLALRVQMTDMPQLVAAFNGFGGGASALVAAAAVVTVGTTMANETAITTTLSLVIGTITLTDALTNSVNTASSTRSVNSSMMKEPCKGFSFFARPNSLLMINWIAIALRTLSSVGVVMASS